jgi:LPXTG-site transpeptidase (sortase) family protein
MSDPLYGSEVTFTFGTLANPGGSDVDLVITYNVIVLNNADNEHGTKLDNSARFEWDDGFVGPDGTTVEVHEPQLDITKDAQPALIAAGAGQVVEFTIHLEHTDASSEDAFDVTITDEIPEEFDYDSGLDCSTTAGSSINPDNPATILPETAGNNGIITATWHIFTLTDEAVCKFKLVTNANMGSDPVENIADVAWESLEIDPAPENQNDNVFSTERAYDPNDLDEINNYFDSSNSAVTPLGGGEPGCTGPNCGGGGFQIPVTGFTPGVFTELADLPAVPSSADTGVALEIPKLKLDMAIVGVPLVKGTWRVDWLTGVGGWLQGTAFPGLSGNSVITSHVVTRFGSNGPFARLNTLAVGDRIYITAFSRQYVFSVKSIGNVAPNDITVFSHAEKPVLTLVTCSKYNSATKGYDGRLVVRAELLQVNPIQ